jgi:hypothetical protein
MLVKSIVVCLKNLLNLKKKKKKEHAHTLAVLLENKWQQ